MKIIIALLTIFTTFFLPIANLLWLMVGFVLLDTAVGIYTAIKLGGMKAFKSHKFFNIAIKCFFYLFSIMLAHTVCILIFGGSTLGIPDLLPKMLTMLWCYIEIKSLDESSMKLGNRSFWVLLKEFFTQVKSIKQDLNDLIDPDTKDEVKEK